MRLGVLVLGGVVLLALLPAFAGVALAHANLMRAVPEPDSASPQSPPKVEAFYSEPLAVGLSSLTVLDTSGQRVDRGDSAVDPADHTHMTVSLPQLASGTYTVYWKNVSDVDGHPLSGTFVFYVGNKPADAPTSATSAAASALVSPVEPFARWAALAGLLAMFGTLLFEFAVLEPAIRGSAGEDVRASLSDAAPVLARLRIVALTLFGLASIAHLAVQGSESAGELSLAASMWRVLLTSQWGRMWLARVALAELVGTIALVAPSSGRRGWAARVVAFAALTGALGTIAFSSHAAADRLLATPAIANEVVHLVAAGIWAGGLVAFLVLALRARHWPIEDRRRLLAAITPRFSPVAFLAAGAIAITGTYGAWIEVARVSALRTPYGIAVLAKAAIFIALLALGAVNLRWVSPRLRHSGLAARVLTRTVAMEVALVLAALLAAGFLASLQPAKQAEVVLLPGPRVEQTVEGARLRIAVEPGRVGTNRVTVDLARPDGTPITNASHVGIRLQFADADIGALDLTVQPGGPGRYVADGAVLSLRGNWQVEATVSRPDGFDARAVLRFAVTPPAAAGGPITITPARQTALLAFGWEIVLLALLLLGVSAAWWSKSRPGKFADWGGAALAIAGILVVYGVGHIDTSQPPPVLGVGGTANPIAADERSIGIGRDLFAQQCVVCHGATGLGDGPTAKALIPPPANLQSHVPLHTDGEIFGFISAGFPGSAMPAFHGQLTDEQMWNLVNYLRTLK